MKQTKNLTQSAFPLGVGYLKALCRVGFDPLTTRKALCSIDFQKLDKKCAFTLAEGATHVAHRKNSRKAAFTLAEVLITLGVVGVVAALTLPSVITNINERVYSTRQANTAYKVTQATDKMKAVGALNGSYRTTDEFVDELQKHLKIVKRCDAAHIADCWPTDKVITSDGEEFEVSKAKTGKNLGIKSNTSDNVGLVLADGASIILTYNQSSQGIDVGDVITAQSKSLPVGFGKSQDFAYTTSTTGAIDFIMDVNGKHGPNSETRDNKHYDIRSFKAARFSTGCDVKIPGIGCVVNLGTSYECVTGSDKQTWDPEGYSDLSCWGGAKKACADIGMSLPDANTLYKIYRKKSEYPDLPQSDAFWSSSEADIDAAYFVDFSFNGIADIEGRNVRIRALCLGN